MNAGIRLRPGKATAQSVPVRFGLCASDIEEGWDDVDDMPDGVAQFAFGRYGRRPMYD